MLNSANQYITDEQNKKDIRLIKARIMWEAQIMFLNYRKCVDEKWIQYFFDKYLSRCKEENRETINIESFTNDLDRVFLVYCDLLSKQKNTEEDIVTLDKIDFVYWDIAEEARLMWNDKIVNK